MKTYLIAAGLALAFATTPALALPLNGTGNAAPDVIFGTGNANGSFTGATGGSIEVGLRAKLRYDGAGLPQNVFNYDGDRTYTFDPSASAIPANRAVFNFEWHVNSDITGTINRNVNDIDWVLTLDGDPSAAVTPFFSGDMINGLPFADHAFGDNSTGNGGGAVATDAADYALFIASNNVAQNSANLGFFIPAPGLPGTYTFALSGSDSTGVLASTSIDVIVQAVPVPATLPFLMAGLGALVLGRRRHRLS